MMPKRFTPLAHHPLVGVVVTSLTLFGLLAAALSLGFRRGKKRAEEEARRRADMIRRRLQDEENVVRRPVQIRVNH